MPESLLDDELLVIPLYYIFRKTKYGSKRLVILDDEKAQVMLEDESKKEDVNILNTKWKQLSWEEQTNLVKDSERRNDKTGDIDFDWPVYRDVMVKKCLKWWDYKINPEDPQPLPCNEDTINRMQSPVINALLDKFNAIIMVEDDELEK
tara:strand:- start:565 stop:1011 length:447 start_codon:yes stop_codon:yes gene_type:complete